MHARRVPAPERWRVEPQSDLEGSDEKLQSWASWAPGLSECVVKCYERWLQCPKEERQKHAMSEAVALEALTNGGWSAWTEAQRQLKPLDQRALTSVLQSLEQKWLKAESMFRICAAKAKDPDGPASGGDPNYERHCRAGHFTPA